VINMAAIQHFCHVVVSPEPEGNETEESGG
jgi:hypothetical protein